MITVVIPYFQRQEGVLRKALASVAAQTDCALPIEVIVVDDASPIPARAEVGALPSDLSLAVRFIEQPNAGPGAARNTGLAAASASTRYIAFLDSDDEWTPRHLARAVLALEQGFDFYFANHFQLGQTLGAFERGKRLDPAAHTALPGTEAELYGFEGDLFGQVLHGNPVGTSTVMFRRDRFAHLRFLVEFTSAGEDYLFWMSLAKAGARAVFSWQVEAVYGRGVNVYSGSGWGTEGYMKRVHQEILYKLAVRKLFNLNAQQQRAIRTDLANLRLAFARDVLRRLRRGEHFPVGLLSCHMRKDPVMLLALPISIPKILAAR